MKLNSFFILSFKTGTTNYNSVSNLRSGMNVDATHTSAFETFSQCRRLIQFLANFSSSRLQNFNVDVCRASSNIMVSWDKFPSILPVLLSVDSFLRTHYIHKHDKNTASHPTQIVESVELANGKIQMRQMKVPL